MPLPPLYAAFISYNVRDRKVAAWLHRALEAYRIPPRLRGRDSAIGTLGTKLPAIFQDREELAASSDLAASVREALEQSSSLIVICSPNAARSQWVNEEIRSFSALGRRHRIQCLIVSGQPNSSRIAGGDAEMECFPPALFERGGSEPLASDIRPGQDSRGSAKLKLLAGIIGIGYDELRQREHARRQRRLAIAAGISAIGFLLMAALAAFALISRQQAIISRQDAIAQRDVAKRKTITAERTVNFVKSMFELADPSESRGSTITAREIIDRAALRVDREFPDEPSVKAELGTTLGEVYTGLGLVDRGSTIIERMLHLPGVDPSTQVRQYVVLAEARVAAADDQGAVAAYQKALALARAEGAAGDDLMPRILAGLGDAQASIGGMDALAERNIRTALQIDQGRGRDSEVDVARDLEALATTFFFESRLPEARKAFEQALTIRRARQSELHPLAIQDLNQLGSVAYMQQDSAAAEGYFREVLPLQERVLGPNHPEIATSLNNLARLLVERRKYADAEPLLRRAIAIQLSERGGTAGDIAFLYWNLAIALRGQGELSAASAYLEKARAVGLAQRHRTLGPVLADLADIACERGRTAEGLALIGQARPVTAKDYPNDPWRPAWLNSIESHCLFAAGRRAEAAKLLQSSAKAVLARWPRGSHYGARVEEISRRQGLDHLKG